jgi:hypothetical protein
MAFCVRVACVAPACFGAVTHADDVSDIPWGDHLQNVATVTHPPLNELSGIARSRAYPGVWWVHNDSGDEPRLFAIDAEGRVVMPVWQRERYSADEPEPEPEIGPGPQPEHDSTPDPAGADTSVSTQATRPAVDKQPWPGVRLLNSANLDWEDLTLADGVIYIADTGNNGNAKRDLGVYIVNEPNPAEMDQCTRPLSFIPIAYPDQHAYPPTPPEDWRFDCEAVFFSENKLYFLTKYRADNRFDRITTGTSLYRLDTMRPNEMNTLALIHRADDLPIIPTSAEVSPNGQRLAVVSHDVVWLYEKPEQGDDWLAGRLTRLTLPRDRIKQAEGVCWDDDQTLRIVNEQRGVLTLDLRPLKPAP